MTCCRRFYVARARPGPLHGDKAVPRLPPMPGLWLVALCSIKIAREMPSIMSTSGLSINYRIWRA